MRALVPPRPRTSVLDDLRARFPCREKECTRLYELLSEPGLALPLYIHGPSGCGKSAVLRAVLDVLGVKTAYLDCITHSTPQALFESALNQLADHRPQASNGYTSWSSCDSPVAFISGLRLILAHHQRVCLVFDKAERLARRSGGLLQTLISLPSLCVASAAALVAAGGVHDPTTTGSVLPLFVGEAVWPHPNFTELPPHFHIACDGDPRILPYRFNGYPKAGLKTLLKRDVHTVLTDPAVRKRVARASESIAASPAAASTAAASTVPASTALVLADDALAAAGGASSSGVGMADGDSATAIKRPAHADAFEAFVGKVVDLFVDVCRDTHELRYQCRQLFPAYLQPALDGALAIDDVRGLDTAMHATFKSAIRRVYGRDGLQPEEETAAVSGSGASLQLPVQAQWLLLASYLASRLPARADVTLFSHAPRKPSRKGSGPRKTKLVAAASPFLLERMLAIFSSIALEESAGGPASATAAASAAFSSSGGGGSSSSTALGALRPGGASAAPGRPPIRAELLVQVAGLIDLGLLGRVTKESQLDTPRLRCQAPKELVVTVAETLKFDLNQYEEE